MARQSKRKKIYREGKIHVCAEKCPTCIFRPGNIMQLDAGLVKRMIKRALKHDSAITCHDTIGESEAICRGFFDLHKYDVAGLRLAIAMDTIAEVRPQTPLV